VLRIWRPEGSSLWLDGWQTGTYPLHELSDIARPLRSSRSLLAATLTFLSGGFRKAHFALVSGGTPHRVYNEGVEENA